VSVATRLRLPAYGGRLAELRKRRQVPNSGDVYIATNDWRLVNNGREDCLVLPPGEAPESFNWSVTAGLPAVLVVNERDLAIADRLAQILIAAGCRGCAALIMPAFGQRVGWHLYRSFKATDAP
jgi:hypothetical protein